MYVARELIVNGLDVRPGKSSNKVHVFDVLLREGPGARADERPARAEEVSLGILCWGPKK